MPTPLAFRAVLAAGGPSFMPTQVVAVPAAALAALGPGTRRVVCTIGGHAERLGLLPQPGGGRYLLLRKTLCQRLGLAVGQAIDVALAPDPSPDFIDLPDELAEALAAWPAAETAFHAHSGSFKRAMARHVDGAKTAETRACRAVQLAERLARGTHPFRAG